MERSDIIKKLGKSGVWEKNEASIWIASNFSLGRNLACNLFPTKLNRDESYKVLTTLKQSLMNTKWLQNPLFYDIGKMKPWEKEYVFEHFLTTYDANDTENTSGMIIDESGSFLAIINEKNHLSLCAIDIQTNWEKIWQKLSKIEYELSESHLFAYSQTFGYLSSDPSSSGTALTVQSFLHLPALIHLGRIDEVVAKEIDGEVLIRGLAGKGDFIGDIVIIQNRFSLGLSEDHILEEVHKSAIRLENVEKEARVALMKSPNMLILDKIGRAVGLLQHSYQIEIKEALSALSLIKLGIDLKWISGLSLKEINTLFFGVRRAHLNGGEFSNDRTPYKRAEFLHEMLKPIAMSV